MTFCISPLSLQEDMPNHFRLNPTPFPDSIIDVDVDVDSDSDSNSMIDPFIRRKSL
jgi:hypothetical protein